FCLGHDLLPAPCGVGLLLAGLASVVTDGASKTVIPADTLGGLEAIPTPIVGKLQKQLAPLNAVFAVGNQGGNPERQCGFIHGILLRSLRITCRGPGEVSPSAWAGRPCSATSAPSGRCRSGRSPYPTRGSWPSGCSFGEKPRRRNPCGR